MQTGFFIKYWLRHSFLPILLVSGISVWSVAQPADSVLWPNLEPISFDVSLQMEVLRQLEAEVLTLPAAASWPAEDSGTSPGEKYLQQAGQYLQLKDYTAATQAAEKALKVAREDGNPRLEMRVLDRIGFISREVFMGASLKAVPYHEKALEVARELNDTAYIARELVALADNYGQALQNDRFLEYAKQVLPYLKSSEALNSRLRFSVMYASFLGSTGKETRAAGLFKKAQVLAHQLGNDGMVQHLYFQLQDLYFAMGEFDRSEQYLDSALSVPPVLLKGIDQGPRYRLAKARGDTAKALEYLEGANQFLHLEYANRSAEQLGGWETLLRTRETELELEHHQLLEQGQRKINWLLAGLLMLLTGILLISLVAWQRQRLGRKELDRQNALNQEQARHLSALDKMKSRFFANISHELRTPLTLIKGPLEQVLKEEGFSPPARQLLETAHHNTTHLKELVDEMLDLTRLDIKKEALEEQATILCEFLEETVKAFIPLAETRQMQLNFHYLPEKDWTLALDRKKLLKILHNLISNALKYASKGGVVELVAERRAESVRIRVVDKGPGIHPDDLPHLFDRYFQSRHTSVSPEGGVGIGLALSHELATLMGGRLWAESTWGQGSTFFLELPVIERPFAEAKPIASGRRHTGEIAAAPFVMGDQQASEGAPFLLVVEDNLDLQQYLRTLLSGEYRLEIAQNGKDALARLEAAESLPNLILSDLMMPVMDGFELLETVRSREAWRHLPVILLTARAERDDRMRAFRTGIDDYLVKPFDAEELLARIENALRRQEVRREWQEIQAAEPSVGTDEVLDNASWQAHVEELIEEHISDLQFSVDRLAELVGMSRTSFYRRIREVSGIPANELIREIRLQAARELLESGQADNLKSLSERVGIRSPYYFSRLYQERFGKAPGELL